MKYAAQKNNSLFRAKNSLFPKEQGISDKPLKSLRYFIEINTGTTQ